MDRLALTTTHRPLPCAILRHHTPTGTHHDWLIDTGNPAPDAALWTARIECAPEDWSSNRPQPLIFLPPHRRVYLKKQGPVSSRRGRVIRVDEGTARIISSHAHGFEAELSLRTFVGSIRVLLNAAASAGPQACLEPRGLARFRVKNL